MTTVKHTSAPLPEQTTALFANRLVNVSTRTAGAGAGTNPAWNAHEWDVKS